MPEPSQTPRIAFRVDAGSGSWQLRRCLALASGLKESEPSCRITFLSHARDASAITAAGYDYIPFGDMNLPSWDLEATAEKVDELGIDMLVVDRHAIDSNYLNSLKEKVRVLAFFDDSLRLESYPVHAVINPNVHAHLLEYPCDRETSLFLGTEFAMLPSEFDQFQDVRCANPDIVRRILIYPGARDYAVEAVRLLKSIRGQFSVSIITGPEAERGEELAREIGIDSRFDVLRSDGSIAKRLASCDFVITGPETLCEPALFALPVALIGDFPASDYAAKNGIALSLGAADSLDAQSASALQALLSDKAGRDRMSARLGELVDGLGRFRLADELLSIYRGEGQAERTGAREIESGDELQVFGSPDDEGENQTI
jgi:spore coat polysaccharide biosynthesis predicted glycosyltransferase SpsG